MATLAERYKIPDEVMAFVDDGTLELDVENAAEKTVEFSIPSLFTSRACDDFTSYSLIWIHPDYNADFCHYYLETPGDLPNFYVLIHSPDGPEEQVDGLDSVDDLVDWLTDVLQPTGSQ